MNVLGFLNPMTQHLVTYKLPKDTYMNSEKFIEFVNDFITKISQDTVLILDNASWHKSELTMSYFKTWEEKGLYILFLPPRSPHYNKIETLWRKIIPIAIGNEWLAIKDYKSDKTLTKKIKEIFQQYGLKYTINFSMNLVDKNDPLITFFNSK